MFLVPEVKFAAPVLLCQCDHDSSQHYNQHGRCGGDDDNCGCVLWDPFSAALAAARGARP
jgi:hypothetical protein